MTAYQVKLSGCDDSTRFVVDLDDAEAAAVERVAELSRQASAFSCQPSMTLTTPPPAPEEDF